MVLCETGAVAYAGLTLLIHIPCTEFTLDFRLAYSELGTEKHTTFGDKRFKNGADTRRMQQ